MKVGLLAYSTNTGLGIQTYNFYKYMKPERVLLIDLHRLNKLETHHEKYPDAFITTDGFPKHDEIDRFLEGLDVVFVCETPLNYYLFDRARQLGIKTVLQYNFELLDYFEYKHWPKPDVFAAPTWWRYDDVPFENKAYLPVPIETNVIQPRFKEKAETFLHIVGRPAASDRNGTEIFLEAASMLKASYKFVLRVQDKQYGDDVKKRYPFIDVRSDDVKENYDIYSDGDVLVMPRRYGGLCLPVNEALAHGMPVIMPNISPNDRLLPDHWLVPAEKSGVIWTRLTIDLYAATPTDIANTMDELGSMESRQNDSEPILYGTHFIGECKEARTIAENYAWPAMVKTYQSFLEGVCNL